VAKVFFRDFLFELGGFLRDRPDAVTVIFRFLSSSQPLSPQPITATISSEHFQKNMTPQHTIQSGRATRSHSLASVIANHDDECPRTSVNFFGS
jgi:hypothetical protein